MVVVAYRHRLGALVVGLFAALASALLMTQCGGSDSAPDQRVVLEVVGSVKPGEAADELARSGALVEVSRPSDEVPPGALPGGGNLAGLVAAGELRPGVVVTEGMFVSAGESVVGVAALLTSSEKTAIAVTLDTTRAGGGWVNPGDRINVLVPGQCADEAALVQSGLGDGEAPRCRRARYLLQAVRVIAVNDNLLDAAKGEVALGPMSGTGQITLLLELTPSEAQWLASWDNEYWVTLVGPDYSPQGLPPLPVLASPLPGETGLDSAAECEGGLLGARGSSTCSGVGP